jgi:predicted RNA binding protein YcfA (HicA-like mRNA interferase family)
MVLRHPDGRQTVVPMHQELRLGTLRRILRLAGVAMDDFTAEA